MRQFLQHSFTFLIAESLGFSCFLGVPRLAAQAAAADSKPQPDVLILIDDERVVGHFVGSTGASLSFKSDTADPIAGLDAPTSAQQARRVDVAAATSVAKAIMKMRLLMTTHRRRRLGLWR